MKRIVMIICMTALILLAACVQNVGMNFPEIPPNVSAEMESLRLLAEQGDAGAQFDLALIYAGLGDANMTVYWFTRSAEEGNNFAKTNLGVMYMDGLGVPQDFERADYWLRIAAEQGMPMAYFHLGLMYQFGRGKEQDFELALYWYRKAVEHDVAYAQVNLGMMYDEGLGVPQSYEQSAYWFRKAAEQGNATALNNLV